MKRLIAVLLMICMLLPGMALAETPVCWTEWLAPLQGRLDDGYTVAEMCIVPGVCAHVVLSRDGRNQLAIVRLEEGAYKLELLATHALRQGYQTPVLLADDGDGKYLSMFYRYEDGTEDAYVYRLDKTGAWVLHSYTIATGEYSWREFSAHEGYLTYRYYENNEKVSLDHPVLLPEAILLDGSLLDTLPLYHKKACAMDALCQGIESYWAVKATGESRVHAERAILGVLRNFDAYLAGDTDAADAMLEAAYESGCAIRISRTTAAHAMSYQITKRIGPAHGHACMLTLPHLWRHMGDAPVICELNTLMGTADGASLMLGLLAATEMLPDTLPDDATLDALAASVNVQRLGNHPEALTTSELRAIYVQAFTVCSEDERARLAALWRKYAE